MPDTASQFGIYLVDKPAGPTSHDVVATIRRGLGRGVKVGHAGTLDPFATGLLVVAVGRATRLIQFLTGHDKTYTARVRLGATSRTGDPEGPIEPTGRPLPTTAQIRQAVDALPGQTTQRVPDYSAVKVAGEPLYKRARRGETIAERFRPIAIRDARLVAADPGGNWFDLTVTCSKGTYVRQVAVDLGEQLGCGGYCERLRRTAVGRMDVARATRPELVPGAGGVDPVDALAPMHMRHLGVGESDDVGHGRSIPRHADDPDGPIGLIDAAGVLAAIAVASDAATVHPTVVLR